ncbi:hypothetical protein [Halorubellus sp. PRR65]|uniref:DUF7541 family protein n=1 Tax=Halorubellus sp. PRR65 TaxID=3098148 RepID=UPI002B2608B7|nr:hypothetical protein [Halorubellus sp. PRR65]
MAKERVDDGTASSEGNRAVTDHKPSASLWPMFVAFGLAIAEVGVVVGVFVFTVVGFLMFTGAVAGILTESGYVERPWRTVGVLGTVVFALGAVVFVAFDGVIGGPELVAVENAVAYRGLSMIAAGVLTVLTAGVGSVRGELA